MYDVQAWARMSNKNLERKKGSVSGLLAGRGKRPAKPSTACTIFILRNSHNYASEKAKENALRRRRGLYRAFIINQPCCDNSFPECH